MKVLFLIVILMASVAAKSEPKVYDRPIIPFEQCGNVCYQMIINKDDNGQGTFECTQKSGRWDPLPKLIIGRLGRESNGGINFIYNDEYFVTGHYGQNGGNATLELDQNDCKIILLRNDS